MIESPRHYSQKSVYRPVIASPRLFSLLGVDYRLGDVVIR